MSNSLLTGVGICAGLLALGGVPDFLKKQYKRYKYSRYGVRVPVSDFEWIDGNKKLRVSFMFMGQRQTAEIAEMSLSDRKEWKNGNQSLCIINNDPDTALPPSIVLHYVEDNMITIIWALVLTFVWALGQRWEKEDLFNVILVVLAAVIVFVTYPYNYVYKDQWIQNNQAAGLSINLTASTATSTTSPTGGAGAGAGAGAGGDIKSDVPGAPIAPGTGVAASSGAGAGGSAVASSSAAAPVAPPEDLGSLLNQLGTCTTEGAAVSVLDRMRPLVTDPRVVARAGGLPGLTAAAKEMRVVAEGQGLVWTTPVARSFGQVLMTARQATSGGGGVQLSLPGFAGGLSSSRQLPIAGVLSNDNDNDAAAAAAAAAAPGVVPSAPVATSGVGVGVTGSVASAPPSNTDVKYTNPIPNAGVTSYQAADPVGKFPVPTQPAPPSPAVTNDQPPSSTDATATAAAVAVAAAPGSTTAAPEAKKQESFWWVVAAISFGLNCWAFYTGQQNPSPVTTKGTRFNLAVWTTTTGGCGAGIALMVFVMLADKVPKHVQQFCALHLSAYATFFFVWHIIGAVTYFQRDTRDGAYDSSVVTVAAVHVYIFLGFMGLMVLTTLFLCCKGK